MGGKQGVSIMGGVQKLELCASSQVLKTLKQMQGRDRPLGLVLRELITVSGAGGGEGERGYIISQQKVEEASLFWHRWRNLFT